MTTDWKALCAELVEQVGFITWGSGTPEDLKELLNRARAALAEPVGEWASMPAAINFMPEAQRRWYVLGWRAAIARWGNPAPQPTAEGKEEQVWPPSVADGCHRGALSAALGSPEQRLLVAAGNTIENLWQKLHRTVSVQAAPVPTDEELLHVAAISIEPYESSGIATGEYEPETECAVEVYGSELIAYARAVLAGWGNPAPQPVPVNERLPGPKDCDSEGRCWWGEPQIEDSHDATWNLCTQYDAQEFLTWGAKCGWLPFHALPLPKQEVSE